MDAETAARLIEINRDFYTRFGDSFSATRHRIQPGVRRMLGSFRGDEAVLDLGCGNGEMARELTRRGHRGPYLGLDFSLPLLREAEFQSGGFAACFMEVDLTRLSESKEQLLVSGKWDLVTAFAVLHHIPSTQIRLDILRAVRELLTEDGRFILSNWQFLKSEKLRGRIQDWAQAHLSERKVDPGDFLLDWRSGGEGLRYVHHFREEELAWLAKSAGFLVQDQFYADGEGGNLSLYQVWRLDPTY